MLNILSIVYTQRAYLYITTFFDKKVVQRNVEARVVIIMYALGRKDKFL